MLKFDVSAEPLYFFNSFALFNTYEKCHPALRITLFLHDGLTPWLRILDNTSKLHP